MSKPQKPSKHLIVSLVKIIIIVALIAMLFFLKENHIVRIFFSFLAAVFTILIEYISNFMPVNNDFTTKTNIIDKKKKTFSHILTIAIIVIAILGNTLSVMYNPAENATNIDYTNSEFTHDPPQILEPTKFKKYNFETIHLNNKYDIYFMESKTEDDLCRDLSYSLRSIGNKPMPSEELLESDNDYGNNAFSAVHYEELLKKELQHKEITSKDVNKIICDKAIECSIKMDNAYDIPDNRNRIIRLTKISYENSFADDVGEMQKTCIRYAWGLLYTEISYDQYSEKTIDILINLYNDTNQSTRCQEIVSALNKLKAEFKYDIPHPNCNIK